MHLLFYPYGEADSVDWLIKQMQCQKYKLPLEWPEAIQKVAQKTGEKLPPFIWVAGNVRRLPGGIIDYVFPCGHLDEVLTSLNFNKPNHYKHLNLPVNIFGVIMRKTVGFKPIPKTFNATQHLIWFKDHVNCIPIGYKPDVMGWQDPNGSLHEAL